jgi:hypothetical protein
MASYHTFSTARLTIPDPAALALAVQAATADPTAVIVRLPDGDWYAKKAAAWTAGDLTAVQLALDTTTARTARTDAQQQIDGWPIEFRALCLALIDETNRLRGALRGLGVAALPDVTPAQAIAAIRAKAGTL